MPKTIHSAARRRLVLASAALLALAAAPAHATTYDFSYTFNTGDVATGSFDGTANGNLITTLSNISVFFDGTAFIGNGSSFASGYDSNGWEVGTGVASFDGTQNNFGFFNSNYPVEPNYTAVFYDLAWYDQAYLYDGSTGTYIIDNPVGV